MFSSNLPKSEVYLSLVHVKEYPSLSVYSNLILVSLFMVLEKLKKYHLDNSIELPQIYIDLFAKHLAAGNPWEP